MSQLGTASRGARAAALGVHIYTASGAVLVFLIVLAAVGHDAVLAFWIGGVAMFIDGTDGALARRFRVREILPWFDGGLLDNIVDYLTYVFAPVVLLWTAGALPPGIPGMVLASLPLLASGYQFCRVDAKTDDHFFRGFPSYWNIVAFYAIVNRMDPLVLGAILLVCSILVFVPILYVYPTRTVTARPITLALTALWGILYGLILSQMPHPSPLLISASYLYLLYYAGLSLYLTLHHRRPADTDTQAPRRPRPASRR